ncbi:Sugar phosphate isomerase/epimerase [Arthrobacter sp. 31Cvi3.1E]|nr:Sugar phosphate isomerase/epimerase [Arthrobacter sp. 31Cvi3.1E]
MQNLAVQLYTVREDLERDVSTTFERLAALGFASVELYGIEKHLEGYRAALDATGISAVSAHSRFIDGDGWAALEAASSIGVTTLIDARVNAKRWSTPADIAGVAADFNHVNQAARDLGITLGYHNHAEEVEVDFGGRTGLEIFADHVDDDVILEVDLYWAEVGCRAAIPLLERLGERVQFLHVKDGPYVASKIDQKALGKGELPLAELLAAAPNATRILELDDYRGDMWEALQTGRDYLTQQLV